MRLLALTLSCLGLLVSPSMSAPAADAASWQGAGLSVDPAVPGPDGSPSLAVAPGARVVLPLRAGNDSGKVVFHIHDDGTVGAPSKARGSGPRWGIVQADGRVLVAGITYAPFLQDDGSLTLLDIDPSEPGAWFNVKYVGGRAKGKWQKWEFDFNPDTGLKISVDGRPLAQNRFDWNQSKVAGFTGLVLYGDNTENPQTLRVSGIDYKLGGPMNAKPVPQPPPAPVVPDEDPAPEGPVPQLKAQFRGQHPRLLVNAESLPRLRAFYQSEEGRPWRESLEKLLPTAVPPTGDRYVNNPDEAQRQGLWRLPTVALHYLLTGDKTSYERALGFLQAFYAQPDWETASASNSSDAEINSGMGAANIMIGAALAYDWLYNDLDPAFREAFGKKLLWHARAMYHGGHLKKNKGVHYWQQDPANNHRWHRNAGMLLCLLAVYEGRPEEQWIAQQAVRDLDYVSRWLPHDGTSHEGPQYLVFGISHLILGLQASDDLFGTTFLQSPFFEHAALFRVHTLLPGLRRGFLYGDDVPNSLGYYNGGFLKAAALHRQSDAKDGLIRMFERTPLSIAQTWFALLWDDPTLPRGDVANLPAASFWPDIGFATMRESWADDVVAASFKSGPFGGYDLNRFRDDGGNYINVAHDDPDANAFLIAIGDELVAETDGYSTRKASRNHNTILVNGTGQMSAGRAEGGQWTQPATSGSMKEMAVVTAWRDTGDIVAIEGEAAGSYLAHTDKKTGVSRPALDRYRRTFLWVKNEYILVLDDIRAPEAVDIEWLVQGPRLETLDEGDGRFVLKSQTKSVPFHLVADHPLTFTVQDSPADHKGKPMGHRQLKASTKAAALRVASVYNPWQKQTLTVRLDPGSTPDQTHILVEGDGIRDRWQWTAAPDRATASTLHAVREAGPAAGFPFHLEPANSIPPK